MAIIAAVKPHVLVGTSTKPKAFTEGAIREMARHVRRPIVLPLSNPTRLHEADPADINAWTEGRALIATGSPFPPVRWRGVEYVVAENNNAAVFPAIGLAAVLCRARRISDRMLVAAVKALAALSPALEDANKGLLPDIARVRDVAKRVAAAVVRCAVAEGLARFGPIPTDSDDELLDWVAVQMWDPVYRPLLPVAVEGASRAARGELGVGRR